MTWTVGTNIARNKVRCDKTIVREKVNKSTDIRGISIALWENPYINMFYNLFCSMDFLTKLSFNTIIHLLYFLSLESLMHVSRFRLCNHGNAVQWSLDYPVIVQTRWGLVCSDNQSLFIWAWLNYSNRMYTLYKHSNRAVIATVWITKSLVN